jgi:hypothetical protein
MVPFLPLLRDEFGAEQDENPIDRCSYLLDPNPAESAHLEIIYYLFAFVWNELGVAVYAWWTPTWTTTLDTFAMLRIGAAVGAPLLPTRDGNEAENERLLFPRNGTAGVVALDQTPGWVADASHTEGVEAVGQLALGTGRKITRTGGRLKYRCD